MAQLSNKIKEYCKANSVSNVDFTKFPITGVLPIYAIINS